MERIHGVARLGSLSVDAVALQARERDRLSPRGSSASTYSFHLADPIQDDLVKALERLNEADNESKRASVHVSPPAQRKLVNAHNSVSYWQGISPEETLRHILDFVHEKLVRSNELNGNIKVVLTYAGTEVWLLVPLSPGIEQHQYHTKPATSEPPDALHAAKIAAIHKDTDRAIVRLLRVMNRMAAAMPDYGVATMVGTQVTYRVFGYEVRIEIEAGAQSVRSFTAVRRRPKTTLRVDTVFADQSSAENTPRGDDLYPRSTNGVTSVDLLSPSSSGMPHTVCITPPLDER